MILRTLMATLVLFTCVLSGRSENIRHKHPHTSQFIQDTEEAEEVIILLLETDEKLSFTNKTDVATITRILRPCEDWPYIEMTWDSFEVIWIRQGERVASAWIPTRPYLRTSYGDMRGRCGIRKEAPKELYDFLVSKGVTDRQMPHYSYYVCGSTLEDDILEAQPKPAEVPAKAGP